MRYTLDASPSRRYIAAMRSCLALLLVFGLASAASAQGVAPGDAPEGTAAGAEPTSAEAGAGATGAGATGAGESGPEGVAPKVAVVVIGDPDDRIRSLARRIDDGLEPELRRAFDPGLRGALRGELGEDGDGLSDVRRDRRRLGAGESSDAPIVASLGRRAGALLVAVVRHGDDGPELVAFDVRSAAFYEGAVPLSEAFSSARVVTFLARRARASLRRTGVDPRVAAALADAVEDEPEHEAQEEDEPDFFEQYWPYFVAAALLGGMIAAIAATSAADGSSQPVLRFVPGGR